MENLYVLRLEPTAFYLDGIHDDLGITLHSNKDLALTFTDYNKAMRLATFLLEEELDFVVEKIDSLPSTNSNPDQEEYF